MTCIEGYFIIFLCLLILSDKSFHSANAELYRVLVKELAQTLEKQFLGNSESRAAGMVINTMGWVEGLGYEVGFTY